MCYRYLSQRYAKQVRAFVVNVYSRQVLLGIPVSDNSSDVDVVDMIQICHPCGQEQFLSHRRPHCVQPAVAIGRIGFIDRPLRVRNSPANIFKRVA